MAGVKVYKNPNKLIEKRYADLADGDDLVSNFYKGSVVLITGGTGFIGKVLIEKLLRVFSIKRIYLLVRVKNNMTVDERLEHFFQESIFDRLRNESSDVIKNVKAIEANFEAHDLNISQENKDIIWDEVDIVFNVVASVKFNEKLRDAVEINVLGTKKILDLVMGIKNLKAFLHISTLYSNCDRKLIEEKVYESDIAYEKIIQITRILDDSHLEKIHHCLIGRMPNTYTMTKQCSENLVNHKAHGLPAGIFRPPIVLSTYKEPVAGWTDNLYGPSGICAGTVRGMVHVIFGNGNKKANLVPADYCVNAMISSAWDTNRRFKLRMENHTEIPVYNYIYDKNNLTWGKYMNSVRKGLHEPLNKAVWYYSYIIIWWKPLFNVCDIIFHAVPAYIMDLIAAVTGKKRKYAKNYQKLYRVLSMMSFFGLREWKFCNKNIDQLSTLLKSQETLQSQKHNDATELIRWQNGMNSMTTTTTYKNGIINGIRTTDKQFNCRTQNFLEFDMQTINWDEYFFHYLPGIKKYFFKEPVPANKNCIKHYGRLKIMHILLKSTAYMLFLFLSSSAAFKYLLSHLYSM